jgi:site-specific DNA-cytosine methylase
MSGRLRYEPFSAAGNFKGALVKVSGNQELNLTGTDSQRYKMLGNAVSVPVVKAVMKKLLEGL